MREENLKVIYEEISELLRHQQASVDILYNKLNWILVADSVFLAALYSIHRPNILVVLLVSISAILCLVSFQPETFKITAHVTMQLAKASEDNFLESLIDKKREAFNANDSKTENIERRMSWSRYLLVAAIALQLLMSILNCHIYA